MRPPVVTAEFWQHPAIQDAAVERHMGRLIAAYRHHPAHRSPVTQELVAQWSDQSQAQISRYENGGPDQQIDRLAYWAQLFDIPEDLLWFQLPDRQRLRFNADQKVNESAAVAPPSRMPGDDDMEDGEVFMSAMQSFRVADRQVGGGYLYDTVARYLRTEVGPKLFEAKQGCDSEFAFRAAASLTEMSGWMAHDAGRDTDAKHHFERALDFVQAGKDGQLEVHILCSLSHLANHQGHTSDAIRFARRAWQQLAKGPRQPELEARALSMRARSHAAVRDRAECVRLLRLAERSMDAKPDVQKSAWVSPFDAGSLASEAARCFGIIGDLEKSQRYAERVVELRPGVRTRGRALGQLILTTVLIAQGRPQEACAIAAEVLAATEQLGSYIVIRQLQALKSQLDPYRADHTVAEFLSCLDHELRQRAWLYRWSANGVGLTTNGYRG